MNLRLTTSHPEAPKQITYNGNPTTARTRKGQRI